MPHAGQGMGLLQQRVCTVAIDASATLFTPSCRPRPHTRWLLGGH